VIELRNLTRRFGDLVAVDDLNLTVDQGDLFGFIGPNGAGKTTTMRILATLLMPTEGEAFVDGIPVVKRPTEVKKRIGFMPDFFGFYDSVRVWECLHFYAAAFKIEKQKRLGLVDDVLELTDLSDRREALVESLSRGMKQRLCLAKTLIHNPSVLILDEPASGLDPRGRIELKALLQELIKMGKTILVSSHILTELGDICNRVGIIEKGQLVATGTLDDIRGELGAARTVKMRVLGDGEAASRAVAEHPQAHSISGEDSVIDFPFAGDDEALSRLIESLFQRDIRVVTVEERHADLNDIFMHVTKGEVT